MSLFRIFFVLCAASSFAATNAAVLSFTPGSGVDSSESLIISERFQTELLATGEYTVLDRQQMAAILQEQGFQQSGACNGTDCTVQIGQLLGVEKIFTGSVSKIGNLFTLNVRRVDVATGRIEAQHAIDSKGGIEVALTESCKTMAMRFTAKASVTEAPKKSSHLWLWIGGGVIVTGGIVAAILLNLPKTVHEKNTEDRNF